MKNRRGHGANSTRENPSGLSTMAQNLNLFLSNPWGKGGHLGGDEEGLFRRRPPVEALLEGGNQLFLLQREKMMKKIYAKEKSSENIRRPSRSRSKRQGVKKIKRGREIRIRSSYLEGERDSGEKKK